MLCSRLWKGRAQVVPAAMPGSLVLKPGLVSSGTSAQFQKSLFSPPRAHAMLRWNPRSFASSVQISGSPACSGRAQAWQG